MSWNPDRKERVKIFIRARPRGLLRDAKAGLAMAFDFGLMGFALL